MDMRVAVYPRALLGYALLAIAQNFLKLYGPQFRNLLFTMGDSAKFCFALWATAQNFSKRYGHSTETHELYLKLVPTLKEILRQKSVQL
jgi:hypothetical protein